MDGQHHDNSRADESAEDTDPKTIRGLGTQTSKLYIGRHFHKRNYCCEARMYKFQNTGGYVYSIEACSRCSEQSLTLARACAAKGYCSRSVYLCLCVFLCSHVFSRTVAAVDTKRGYVGMCIGRSAQQESGAVLSKNSMFTAQA